MAKRDKAPEQDSAPAVKSDVDISTEGQQTSQPEAPPVEIETKLPEMSELFPTPGEVVIPAEITEQLIAEKNGGKIAAAKEAEAAAAVIDFSKKEPSEDTWQEWEKPLAEIEAEQQPKRRGRQPKADKTEQGEDTSGQVGPKSEKSAKQEKTVKAPKAEKAPKPPKEEKAPEPPTPPEPEKPPEPIDATRPGEVEQIVYLNLSDLHPFKNHPFQVKEDEEMRAMVSSVKDKGVTQPAIVRPREDGGYELVSGHLKLYRQISSADSPTHRR